MLECSLVGSGFRLNVLWIANLPISISAERGNKQLGICTFFVRLPPLLSLSLSPVDHIYLHIDVRSTAADPLRKDIQVLSIELQVLSIEVQVLSIELHR